jgi:hypothetical protein
MYIDTLYNSTYLPTTIMPNWNDGFFNKRGKKKKVDMVDMKQLKEIQLVYWPRGANKNIKGLDDSKPDE